MLHSDGNCFPRKQYESCYQFNWIFSNLALTPCLYLLVIPTENVNRISTLENIRKVENETD
jgi:hypothetical protein